MAEVVFAMAGVGNFFPAEVDATSRAGFSDGREKIHDRCRLEYESKNGENEFET